MHGIAVQVKIRRRLGGLVQGTNGLHHTGFFLGSPIPLVACIAQATNVEGFSVCDSRMDGFVAEFSTGKTNSGRANRAAAAVGPHLSQPRRPRLERTCSFRLVLAKDHCRRPPFGARDFRTHCRRPKFDAKNSRGCSRFLSSFVSNTSASDLAF